MSKRNASKLEKAAAAPDPAVKKRTFRDVPDKGLRLALEAAGGYPQLAAALGISRQSVHKFRAIPDRFAVRVEELYGIPRSVIAPHLYVGMQYE